MKNTPDGISSRLVTTEEKMSEFDATARETQNKCQMKPQKIKREQEKWTVLSAVEQLQVT